MKQGDIIRYTYGFKNEVKECKIVAFGYHHSFMEVVLENGDCIHEDQVIEIL